MSDVTFGAPVPPVNRDLQCGDNRVSITMTSDSETNERYLRGAAKLTVDALIGVVDIVESMHRRISTLGGLLANGQLERTSGLTGFVYSNIRTVATLLGEGLDMALKRFTSELEEIESSQTRQALLAALNGVIGDYLETSNNPLAIDMTLRQNGQPWTVDEQALQRADGRVLLMIHGSCGNDLLWLRNNHNHGTNLADEFGFVPVYLHYNSGRHISENGSELSDLLEAVVTEYPEIQKLAILAHSMGGLVARSAYFYAEKADHTWPNKLKNSSFWRPRTTAHSWRNPATGSIISCNSTPTAHPSRDSARFAAPVSPTCATETFAIRTGRGAADLCADRIDAVPSRSPNM